MEIKVWRLHQDCFQMILMQLVSFFSAAITISTANFPSIYAKNRSETFNFSMKQNPTLDDLKFPPVYHAAGIITLPSSGVIEPFEAWYAWRYNKSRIDYYGGTVKTFQRGDLGKYGTLYEIVPKYDYRNNKHFQGCWKKVGKKDKKVTPQGVIPKKVYWPFKMNLTDFKYDGLYTVNNQTCARWIATKKQLSLNNTYIFYTSNTKHPKPIRYEMHGYDTLLISYYDSYIFDYEVFEEWKYNKSLFDIPKDLEEIIFNVEDKDDPNIVLKKEYLFKYNKDPMISWIKFMGDRLQGLETADDYSDLL